LSRLTFRLVRPGRQPHRTCLAELLAAGRLGTHARRCVRHAVATEEVLAQRGELAGAYCQANPRHQPLNKEEVVKARQCIREQLVRSEQVPQVAAREPCATRVAAAIHVDWPWIVLVLQSSDLESTVGRVQLSVSAQPRWGYAVELIDPSLHARKQVV